MADLPDPRVPPAAGPDVSVRVAWSADADAVAAVQVAAWRSGYADLLPPELLDALDPEDFAERWTHALTRPDDARHRVLIALERDVVHGFAVTGPCTDPDADQVADGLVAELAVRPGSRRQGHGSRLLHACADTLRSDRFRRAVIWVNAGDDDLRSFLAASGWAPDSAHRELDLHGDGSVLVKQVRLHTDLTEASP